MPVSGDGDARAAPGSHPALRKLDALAAEWEFDTSVGGRQVSQGRTTFEWFNRGQFLLQRTDGAALPGAPPEWVENAPFPVTSVIGLDDMTGQFTMLYADARNVFRVYQLSLDGGVWRIWRDAPGFSQRFTATFEDGGNRITGQWETSTDGSRWEHDFDMTYTRVR